MVQHVEQYLKSVKLNVALQMTFADLIVQILFIASASVTYLISFQSENSTTYSSSVDKFEYLNYDIEKFLHIFNLGIHHISRIADKVPGCLR